MQIFQRTAAAVDPSTDTWMLGAVNQMSTHALTFIKCSMLTWHAHGVTLGIKVRTDGVQDVAASC